METDSLQHCSTVSNMRMGLNSHPTFGAQGDQTNTKLTLLPVRENPLDQQMTQHSEQLTKTFLSNPNINWDMDANYLNNNNNNNNNYVHLNDCVLQSNSQSTKSIHDEDLTNSQSTNKQNFTNFSNTDLNGSKVIRLVRAKQATKRKSSLDTLIEVVQKELLRVNGQSNSSSPSSSPPPHHSQTRSTTNDTDISINSSSNCQINPSRKRSNHQSINSINKRIHTNRNHSFSTDDEYEQSMNNNHHSTIEENIDEIVRDTVDKLVAITLLNNAPFIVNMITGTNTNTDTKSVPTTNGIPSKPIVNNSDLALLSSTASELRNSMQQVSPMKSPANSSTILTNDSSKSSTVFVTPRILNFQTVVPKPTTNIQIGNTKIILVSPTNPSSSSSSSSPSSSSLTTNTSPVKLVKLTPTLQKNVQIVIPSRTINESLSTTIRPLTTCSIDQIPQAAQEVTITTSPNFNKPRRRSSSTTPTDKPVGKILRPIAKVLPVYPPNNATDEIPKPMTVNFSPRVPSTHGPMIYRMTSVNPNVPVFRVRAPTTPTAIKTETKSLSIAKQPQPSTTGASVSVVACIKTTKKRAKERAIMPRPTATTTAVDSLEPSSSSHDPQSRLTSTNSAPLLITNSNSNEQANHRPTMEDKSIQCLQDHKNSTTDEQTIKHKKRNGQIDDDSWTVAADTLLRNVLSQYGFRFLDLNCQQNLSAKFDMIQANLVSGMISSKDDFYKSVVDIKENLLENGLSKISADNLEKLFLYFENEYPKISDGNFSARANDRKRTRRQ